jgi:hypothetical protein
MHLRGFILKYLRGFQMKHKKKWHFIQLVELNCPVTSIRKSITVVPVMPTLVQQEKNDSHSNPFLIINL